LPDGHGYSPQDQLLIDRRRGAVLRFLSQDSTAVISLTLKLEFVLPDSITPTDLPKSFVQV